MTNERTNWVGEEHPGYANAALGKRDRHKDVARPDTAHHIILSCVYKAYQT